MYQSGAGDSVTPFSGFVDVSKLLQILKGPTRPASPTTVTSIIELPASQNKRSLKSYLREKLFLANHDIRSVLYKSLVKRIDCNENMFSKEMYNDFVTENFTNLSSNSEIPLPNFVFESDLPIFYLNDTGIRNLYKILACIGYNFPQVTHSPVLGIAAALFLHYDDDPAQVFTHVCRLVFANSKQIHYLDISKIETDASSLVLKELSQRYASSSHKSLLTLTSDPINVYSEWIRCLFSGLPFTFVVVLFDMYLLEGYKSLYRVSLAILKFYRKMGVSSTTDMVSAIFQFVQDIESRVTVAMLFRKAFGFKVPPGKDIKKLHKRIQSNLVQHPISTTETKHHRNPWDYLSLVRDIKSDIVNETLLSTLYCSIPEEVALYKPKVIFSTNTNGYHLQTLYSCAGHHEPTILLIKTVNDEVLGAYLSSAINERRNMAGFFGTGETFIFSLLPEAKIYKWVELVIDKSNDADNAREYNNKDQYNKKMKVLPPVKPPTKTGKGVTLPPIRFDSSIPGTNVHQSRPANQDTVSLPPLVGISYNQSIHADQKPVISKISQKNDMFIMADDSTLIIGGGGGGYGIFIDASLSSGRSQNCSTFGNQPLVLTELFTCSIVEVLGFDKT